MVDWDWLKAFSYVTPVDNVASILEHGILCKRDVASIEHVSSALDEIQDWRSTRVVPGSEGKVVHDFVNLFINPRNATLCRMMYSGHKMVILHVDRAAANCDGVFVTRRNAASANPEFHPYPGGMDHLEASEVYRFPWNVEGDEEATRENKQLTSAEVLIPDRIDPGFITRITIPNQDCMAEVEASLNGQTTPVTVNSTLFCGIEWQE